MTAEVVAQPDERWARRITERIRLVSTTARESLEKLQRLVEEAKAGEAHLLLGFHSWTAYLADVMGDEPLRLAREERQQLVGYLANEGMSTRAIAPIVGASRETVRIDLASGDKNLPPEPQSKPGWQSPSKMLRETKHDDTDPDVAAEDPEPEPAKVTGLDGKSYVRAERKQPRRRPINDACRDVLYDLNKRVESLRRLIDDDRFPANASAIADAHYARTKQAANTLAEVLATLETNRATGQPGGAP